ncbi:hypothetical protein [Kitasatospora griseola]
MTAIWPVVVAVGGGLFAGVATAAQHHGMQIRPGRTASCKRAPAAGGHR